MIVAEWLFILLAILSCLLVIGVIFFLVTFIKNLVRRHQYNKLRPSLKNPRDNTFSPKGLYEKNAAAIPKTYPTALQTASHLTNVTLLGKSDLYSRSASISSRYTSGSSLNDHRNLVTQYASQTLDDAHQRKLQKTRSGFEIRRANSTQLEMVQKEEGLSRSASPYLSLGEGINRTENDSSAFVPVGAHRVYSHSDLLPDANEVVPYESDEIELVSYDQENDVIKETVSPGSLCFTLEYDSMAPLLSIFVKSGVDLQPVSGDFDSPLSTYVNLCLVPEDFLWQRTSIVENNRYPVYNETFLIPDVLYHKLREYSLCFYLMECNDSRGERVIGKVLYPLSDLRAQDRVEVCKELSPL